MSSPSRPHIRIIIFTAAQFCVEMDNDLSRGIAVSIPVLCFNNPGTRHTPSGSASRTFRGSSLRQGHGITSRLHMKCVWGRFFGSGRWLIGPSAGGPGPTQPPTWRLHPTWPQACRQVPDLPSATDFESHKLCHSQVRRVLLRLITLTTAKAGGQGLWEVTGPSRAGQAVHFRHRSGDLLAGSHHHMII